ncbi:hypothetical protein PINS_up006671 [Pythium insidiosum]|nr:hypothetical protein PINS_up006671 [Pythium insidiosum]
MLTGVRILDLRYNRLAPESSESESEPEPEPEGEQGEQAGAEDADASAAKGWLRGIKALRGRVPIIKV